MDSRHCHRIVKTSILVAQFWAAPMPSGISSTGAVARGPKFEKALKRTKQSAITMAVLLGAVIVAGNLGLPAAVGGISLLGSMAAAVVTVIYGIVAIVNKTQNK